MNLKDFFSLANLSLGALAVYLSAVHLATFLTAFVLIILAVVMDFLDGKIARASKPNAFGRELDSLSDLCSFGVAAPLVSGFFYGNNFTTALGIVFFSSCAAVRLAKFNLQKEKNVFRGLPSPAAAFLLLALAPLAGGLLFVLMIILGLLMVSPLEFRKVL